MAASHSRGRPPASSQETLQDAAFDLFLEKSYADTSVLDITQRAGVSRATFFNYFEAKSDVFWVELDQALSQLREQLGAAQRSAGGLSPRMGLEAVVGAFESFAAQLQSHQVPFALTQHHMIGSVNELQASALNRFSLIARVITDFLEAAGHPTSRARAASYALIAAAVAAAQEWASAGTARGSLPLYVTDALLPVLQGFTPEES